MLMQFTHRHTSESFRGHSTQPVETYQKSYDGDVTIHIDLAYMMHILCQPMTSMMMTA